MGNSGTGGRLASWVDSTPWTGDGPDDQDDEAVEFLEAEPSAYRLSTASTPEVSESIFTSSTGRLLALGAVGVVLLALAIMSRPGDQDAFQQLPTATQQEILERQGQTGPAAADGSDDPAAGADASDGEDGGDASASLDGDSEETEGDGTEGDGTAVAGPGLAPFGRLRTDLPEDLAGTLFTTGADGSVVIIRWDGAEIDEIFFPDDEAGVDVQDMQLLDSELLIRTTDGLLQLTSEGRIQGSTAPVSSFLGSDAGLTFSTDRRGGGQAVYALPAAGSPPTEPVEPWQFADDLELAGIWDGRMLVAKAGQVWLTDTQGGAIPVGSGEIIAYDGRHLAMLRCLGPSDCRIDSGTPEQPRRSSVPVPPSLAGREVSDWAASVTLSPDGRYLAAIDNSGPFPLPVLVDLETGEESIGPDIANRDTPLVWSPDGRFLAHSYNDDLGIWDRVEDRAYLIVLNREIELLAWAATEPTP